jgi:hypothetical protein
MARKRRWAESKRYQPSKYRSHSGWGNVTGENEFVDRVGKKGLLNAIGEEFGIKSSKRSRKRSPRKRPKNNSNCCCCSSFLGGVLLTMIAIIAILVIAL